MSVLMRVAGVGDLADVIALERGVPEAPHWGDEKYAEMVGGIGVRRCLLVAELAGRVVGFAVGKVVVGLGELESVAVRADARRSGVGRMLCEAVVEWCRTEGSLVVELEVRAASAGAIALYNGLGFVEVGRRWSYYRDPEDDAVLMRQQMD